MKKFIQELDNIISEFNNQINDNLIGMSYLENLKYYLIDNIKKEKLDLSSLDHRYFKKKLQKIGN